MLRILLASKSERRLEWLDQNLSLLGAKIDSRPLLASEINAIQGLDVGKQVEMQLVSSLDQNRVTVSNTT